MGCGVSKIDANGDATPSKSILSSFPHRKRQSTRCIPSNKKEPLLLMPENDDRPSTSSKKCDDNLDCVTPQESKKEDDERRIARIRTMVEEAEKNDEDEGEEEDDNDDDDDDQRAINKVRVHVDEEDADFPASPSFRVYFTNKDNEGSNNVGLKDVTPSAATISSTKELAESTTGKEEEKKEIRKRSTFRNVLPRNLLNARSSSNSPTRSSYHHKVAS